MDAFVGNDEESIELRKLVGELQQNPDSYETWEKLVKCGESLEGGINRNSSSQAITAVRDIYDRFLAKFPLFFGFWKKYADLEFSIAGTEAAELVYERGVASITNSVDLWTHYCSFKTETSHDPDVIRDMECRKPYLAHWKKAEEGGRLMRCIALVEHNGFLQQLEPHSQASSISEAVLLHVHAWKHFNTSCLQYPILPALNPPRCMCKSLTSDFSLFERGSNCVGLDFLAHPFWDKYLEFEERNENQDRIFSLLGKIIAIPLHQYARYFEKYRQMAPNRPLSAIAPPGILTQYQMELENEGAGYKAGRTQVEVERDLRARIDTHHLETFNKTQAETTKRWPFESEIKRPYFHVTELDQSQVDNWRKYLDFEEGQADYARTQFLYERCLVTCAQHDDFWLRYARWMFAQPGKEEEVRNIYQRASYLFVPIALPAIRHQWACFEEMSGRAHVAEDIHKAILSDMPSHVETIVSLANLSRRQRGLDAAIAVYEEQIESAAVEPSAKAALVAEQAKLLWRIKGASDEARKVFQKNQNSYLDSAPFWISFLRFEIEQPASEHSEKEHYEQTQKVIDDVLNRTRLPISTVQELVTQYMQYLLDRGSKDAAKEYLNLDREINGPASVQTIVKGKGADPAKGVNGQAKAKKGTAAR